MADALREPKEMALLLGPRKSMVGVLAPGAKGAESADSASAKPMVVVLNAGIIHRVGPNRLHVALARQLAARGYDVLRFDLSGIGDSAPRDDALHPFESALADIREVLDGMESMRGVERFILIGLCSGADQALIASERDPRVVALGLLDPSIPRTRGYFLRHWSRRLLSLRTWRNVLVGKHSLWRRLAGAGARNARVGEAPAAAPLTLESPAVRAALESAYRQVIARRVKILAVFAGSAGREYRLNYRAQMLEAFPTIDFASCLRIEFFKDVDHTFSGERDRALLLSTIEDWFGSGAARGWDPSTEGTGA
jgi:pimeloyl-ACP methyl ester carboxylesterase